MARSRSKRARSVRKPQKAHSKDAKRLRQSAGVKAYWASLSPKARRARIKASVEGRGLVYRPK